MYCESHAHQEVQTQITHLLFIIILINELEIGRDVKENYSGII
jgi:hypothetical protein